MTLDPCCLLPGLPVHMLTHTCVTAFPTQGHPHYQRELLGLRVTCVVLLGSCFVIDTKLVFGSHLSMDQS